MLKVKPLATLVVNKLRGTFKVLQLRHLGQAWIAVRQCLEDIAVLTGATVISEDAGYKLENANLDYLGTAKRVVSDKDNTTIKRFGGGKLDAIKARINRSKSKLKTTSDYDREKPAREIGKTIWWCCCYQRWCTHCAGDEREEGAC
ncbi:MAG: hypothetical protein CM15mP64_5970 [Candidatus Neomarinimicrobiota bacterium]|nr:MAG: hypothetical protein CM15mP64_5970 [Candidatus Neomarinimicrobiota bacterium]